MAKITAPLHSMTASKSIGKSVTFRNTKGGAVATRFPRIGESNTTAQALNRSKYQDGVTAWNALTDEQKAEWKIQADKKKITGFNEFMSVWMTTESPEGGAIWDAGASTWDGGSSIWIN